MQGTVPLMTPQLLRCLNFPIVRLIKVLFIYVYKCQDVTSNRRSPDGTHLNKECIIGVYKITNSSKLFID